MVAEATIAVAEAKILTTEIAILASNKLFELAGTRSTLAEYRLDRRWRNARTHTLHDPVRWKFFHTGNYHLNDATPKNSGWLQVSDPRPDHASHPAEWKSPS